MVNAVTGLSPAREAHFKTHESKIVKIQSVVRTWLTKRKLDPEHALLKSINFSKLEEYEHFEGSEVFLVKNLVIKKRSKNREVNNSQAKALCSKEKLDRLVIANCRVYKNHIIEDLLPLAPGFKGQMGVYIENHQLFDEAIKQFITFYLQSGLDDIVGNSFHPYQSFSAIPIPRYDNVCFILEEGKGKIALVDLEEFKLSDKWHERDLNHCLKELVTLFPYHLELILKEFITLFPAFKVSIKTLQTIQKSTLGFFENAYFQHKSFLMARNVSLESPALGISISHEEIKSIAEETHRNVDKVISTVKTLNMKISYQPCATWPELLSKRTLYINFGEVDYSILKPLKERMHIADYASFGTVCVHV